MDLAEVAAAAGRREGTVWTLEEGEDLNANLVRFSSTGGIGKHTNEEVDVILVGISGLGSVVIDGEEHDLAAGELLFVPKGVSREIQSASEDLVYLSIHRRRGPIGLGDKAHGRVREVRAGESAGGGK